MFAFIRFAPGNAGYADHDAETPENAGFPRKMVPTEWIEHATLPCGGKGCGKDWLGWKAGAHGVD